MKRRIKIVFVIRQLIIGGAESQTYELARNLDRDKYEIVVCSLQKGGYFAEKLKNEGIPVTAITKRWRYDITVLLRLILFLKRERPDIVHCVMWTANMWGGLASLIARVNKLVLSTRSIGIWKNKRHYLTGPLIFNRADAVLANSTEVCNYMVQKEGINPDKIRIIYNGLNREKFLRTISPEELQQTRKAIGLAVSDRVIGTVANFSIQKDYPAFLRAAARVAAMQKDIRFLIVGDGDLRPMIESGIQRSGLAGRVILTGQSDDVRKYLACMDVFVLASLREGFSNALLEAMAAGLPVIATRVGGNSDAVQNGVSGILFEVGNDEVLAGHMLELINAPGKAKAYGEKAAQKASEFSMSNFIKKMDTFYSSLMVESES